MVSLPRGYRLRGQVACSRARCAAASCCNPPAISQSLNHHLRLLQRIENLPIQALIPQLPVEAFTVAVFPRTPRLDVQRSDAYFRQPLPQLLRDELRASASITSYRPSLLATRIARHSRVNSSISVSMRMVLPSCVLALTKS